MRAAVAVMGMLVCNGALAQGCGNETVAAYLEKISEHCPELTVTTKGRETLEYVLKNGSAQCLSSERRRLDQDRKAMPRSWCSVAASVVEPSPTGVVARR